MACIYQWLLRLRWFACYLPRFIYLSVQYQQQQGKPLLARRRLKALRARCAAKNDIVLGNVTYQQLTQPPAPSPNPLATHP